MSVKNLTNIALAGIAGAGLMYLLDPVYGRRRRAILQDKAIHYSRVAGRTVNINARDAAHRMKGLVAESKHAFRSDDPIDDVLVDRVRSSLGRVSTHPSSIKVNAKSGRITLSGQVPDKEHDRLLKRVQRVRGVHTVDDKLNRLEEQISESAGQDDIGAPRRASR